VAWSSWVEYVDEDDDGNRPTVEAFEEATGISVGLREDINDNNEFDAKVRPQLEAGQDIGRDLVVLTDWLCAKWNGEGFAQELDRARMPNSVNVIDGLSDVVFDPNREYTLPWQAGYTAWATTARCSRSSPAGTRSAPSPSSGTRRCAGGSRCWPRCATRPGW
jgi:spermidine/putrescine transport system substrate-binding protein